MSHGLTDVNAPIELGGVVIGADGELSRREPKFPIAFQFNWREMNFEGDVARVDGALVLKITADVATVPFSAEDAERRAQLLSLLRAGAPDSEEPLLVLSPSNVLTLRRQIELPRDVALTADRLIIETATAVLMSAPYLDLMANGGDAAP
ncbi:MAG: hypothetical protein EXQ98_01800 [Alphaproteobacteria bacterium]|nr:hypothetical protein [Alphaproteobacteria bacterium]